MGDTSDDLPFSDRDDVEYPDDAEEMGTYAANSPQIPVGRYVQSVYGRAKQAIFGKSDSE